MGNEPYTEQEYKRAWKGNNRSVRDLIEEWPKSRWPAVIKDELINQSKIANPNVGFTQYIANGLNGVTNQTNSKPIFTQPTTIPKDIKELSILNWARWIYWHQDEWKYSGCKYPEKSREWVTAKDRDSGRDIDNQKLLREYEWTELSDNQLWLVRGTINAFIIYLRSIGFK
jgi:hypothetical protein